MTRRRALLVGNSTFPPEARLSELFGPLNDIEAMDELLGSPGPSQFEVASFPNQDSRSVEVEIEKALSEAGSGDLVLIYYAGHGLPDRVGNLVLATSDTNREALLTSTVSFRRIRDFVRNSNCQEVILLLDCCYSGSSARERGSMADQFQAAVTSNDLFILASSSEVQTSAESESEHFGGRVLGNFTAAIVEGIRTRKADRNTSGRISLHDLCEFVSDRISPQRPVIFMKGQRTSPLIYFTSEGAAYEVVKSKFETFQIEEARKKREATLNQHKYVKHPISQRIVSVDILIIWLIMADFFIFISIVFSIFSSDMRRDLTKIFPFVAVLALATFIQSGGAWLFGKRSDPFFTLRAKYRVTDEEVKAYDLGPRVQPPLGPPVSKSVAKYGTLFAAGNLALWILWMLAAK